MIGLDRDQTSVKRRFGDGQSLAADRRRHGEITTNDERSGK